MQQKEIAQKQFKQQNLTQRNLTQRNMTQQQFTRSHNSHEHQMTLSTPQEDMRQFNIPSGTIVEEAPRKVRFAYLRSWIMSLLALVVLPLGLIFILVGGAIADGLPQAWESTTAQIRSVDNGLTTYSWFVGQDGYLGSVSRDWQTYVKPTATGELVAQVSLCDIASVVMIRGEIGSEFTVWYNPQNPDLHQCVPMSQDAGAGFVVAGWIMVALSLLTFLRIFHRAGVKLAQDNR